MTHEERNNIVGIVIGLIVMIFLATKLSGMNNAGAFDGADAIKIWARTVLWVIPFSIVAMIVMTILFNIIFAIVTNNKNPSFVVDERDKQINSLGAKVTSGIMGAGFILALLLLAYFDWRAIGALNIMFFTFAIADFLGNVTKLVLWRRGM